jgi:hypothetical protein
MTTDRVLVGTQPAASLHQRSVVEGTTDITVTCIMSLAVEEILSNGVNLITDFRSRRKEKRSRHWGSCKI